MAFADLRSQLTCCICREIYTDPVTLPCGHNYCRDCIRRTWDWQLGIEEDPSCPECRHRYRRRPELNRNLRLQSITKQFLPIPPEQEGAGIFCTYCDSAVPAAKSCLQCEASLCALHLLKHSKSDKHILIDPMKRERGKCFIHGRNLEFTCTEDGARICASCWLAGEHQGHKVELLNETERRAQSLNKSRREAAEKAASETERVTALFRDMREQLKVLEKRLLRKISRYNENISLKHCDPMQQLEVWKPLMDIFPYIKVQSQRAESEGQNLWTLISKTLLKGLDEIVADVKEKIHGHQVRPQVHDVPGKNVPEHSLKAVGFPSVKVKAGKILWGHSEWPLTRTAPSDQKTEAKASASATSDPFSLVFGEMRHQFEPAGEWSESFPMESTITEVPLPVQPQVHVPGEKVHEHSHRPGWFPSSALTALPMEDLRASKSLQDYDGKQTEAMRQREMRHGLFSRIKALFDHKTEGQKNSSPTVEPVKIQPSISGNSTPPANSLEGATEKWPWSFSVEETTKTEDTLFNFDDLCFTQSNTFDMDLSTSSSSSS